MKEELKNLQELNALVQQEQAKLDQSYEYEHLTVRVLRDTALEGFTKKLDKIVLESGFTKAKPVKIKTISRSHRLDVKEVYFSVIVNSSYSYNEIRFKADLENNHLSRTYSSYSPLTLEESKNLVCLYENLNFDKIGGHVKKLAQTDKYCASILDNWRDTQMTINSKKYSIKRNRIDLIYKIMLEYGGEITVEGRKNFSFTRASNSTIFYVTCLKIVGASKSKKTVYVEYKRQESPFAFRKTEDGIKETDWIRVNTKPLRIKQLLKDYSEYINYDHFIESINIEK